MVNPEGVFQVLREQNAMSTPIRATLWIHVAGSTPCPIRSAMSSGVSHSGHTPPRPHRTSKHVALAASTLAEKALTAPPALVDRVSHQHFSALKCSAHSGQIGGGRLMTEAITALLASACAVPHS